jgi:cysteine desulfurase
VIFADNAATTKISELALAKMFPYLQGQYGNASSQYSLGVRAKQAVEQARRQVGGAIGAKPAEIIFTSGASESNSWVFRSVVDLFKGDIIHIITSAIEHPSVLNTCHALEAMGVEVTFLPVDSEGIVSLNDLKSAIRANTKLVSIMFANNEIGTIQPIPEIGTFLNSQGIWLHTDAAQAVGHIPVNVNELHVDFLSATAHKFNGAKGTGFLYKRSGISLPSLIIGGAQEHGYRAGTENVAGIVGAGFALTESIGKMELNSAKLRSMIDEVYKQIKMRIPKVQRNGSCHSCLPGVINLGFDGISGETLMNLLDLKGICVSTSSACHSGNNVPSHVLLALGRNEQEAQSAIRISFGTYNTVEEARAVATAVCEVYDKIVKQ